MLHQLPAVFAALSTLVAAASDARAASLQGRATVIDGDTIDIHGERVRLHGIDAPESTQWCIDIAGAEYRCGKVAAEALDAFLAASRPVTCEFVDRDRSGRFVGRCFRADRTDVAAWLVKHGYALDWPLYSHGEYAAQQATARAERAGIWQGDFQEPWAFRRDRRAGATRQ
jgi:endonuclease YncB( thermonuclease family)